jgi:subtilisin family serine protease
MRNIWHVLGLIALVFTLLSCFLFQPASMSADDPSSKISSSLLMAIDARTATRQPLLKGMLQGQSLDPFNVSVFIYMNSKPGAAQIAGMASLGTTVDADSWIPPVGTHPRGFVTALVPVDRVNDLAAQTYVIKLDSAEGQSYPLNDEAAALINAGSYWSGGYNGVGVRVAVLDSGLDTTHPDIPGPVVAKDYWAYPLIGDNVTSPIPGGSSHGTHVTGSVLGRGTLSGGKYKGMASGAELVFIKIGNNTNGGASEAAMCAALKAAVDMYGANIVSMSYGGWSPHHDGTDANCQAADYAVSRGAAVFISAGNEAAGKWHYRDTVKAGESTDFIQVNVTGSDGNNCMLYHNLVWYDGLGVNNELTLQYYDSAKVALTTLNSPRWESDRGTEQRYNLWNNLIPAGNQTYYIKVGNASARDQDFHVYYLTNFAVAGSKVEFASPDLYYTLGSPGEADSVICVGSFNSRRSWTDYTGTQWNFGETLGEVSSFSSRGPRVDTGAPQKPNLVAPGSAIISCRDRSNPLNSYTISDSSSGGLPADYYVMQGTSMATPIAAGAAAILMQAYPGLKGNPSAVKALLQPANTPDNDRGYGLINLNNTRQKTAPAITSVNPASGLWGLSQVITFRGNNFDGATAVSFGERIGSSFTVDSATQITANINIEPGAMPGNRDVSVTTPGGTATLTGGFSVIPQMPTGSHGSGGAATTAPASPGALPAITVQSARLSARAVTPGTPVTVTADLTNSGPVNGSKEVTLYVNGKVESTQGVTVDSGGSSQLTFSTARREPGDYTVSVDGQPAGSFKVEAVTANNALFIVIVVLIAISFVFGLVMLLRRQQDSG